MLLETHALFHQSSPRGHLLPLHRPPDSSRDPLAVGQVRPGVLLAPADSDDSDQSEPELSIDLTAQPVPEDGQSEAPSTTGTTPKATSGTPSWHTPQADTETTPDVDEEMAEMLRHAGIEVTNENSTSQESSATKEGEGEGEDDEHRGQEFTLTEEEASASLDKDVICEQVFFDDQTDSDDDSEEEEPRLKIVSAYTISPSDAKNSKANTSQ